MNALIRIALALTLAACGGTSVEVENTALNDGSAQTAGAEAPSCAVTPADVASGTLTGLPGTHLRVRLPAGFVPAIGGSFFVHDCGAVITLVEAPPAFPAEQRELFLNGLRAGFIQGGAAGGMDCSDMSTNQGRCAGDGVNRFFRVIDAGQTVGMIITDGGLPPETARAILASAAVDYNASWDPIAAMRIALPPVPGLILDPLSLAPTLTFRSNTGAAGNPVLLWRFSPYTSHPAHADGSRWTDREIGERIGRHSIDDLGITQMNTQAIETTPLRETALGQDAELVVPGTSAEGAVLVYAAYFRENFGVFMVMARVPAQDAPAWLPRFRAQVHAYRVVE